MIMTRRRLFNREKNKVAPFSWIEANYLAKELIGHAYYCKPSNFSKLDSYDTYEITEDDFHQLGQNKSIKLAQKVDYFMHNVNFFNVYAVSKSQKRLKIILMLRGFNRFTIGYKEIREGNHVFNVINWSFGWGEIL